MPTSYNIDRDRRMVFCRAWGELSSKDVLEHYQQMRDDPAFDATFQQLGDLREVSKVTATKESVRDAARMHVFEPGTRRAFVADNDTIYGMARMFAAYSHYEDQDLEVFRDMNSAQQWLGEQKNG
jgi:hypothetical protein